MRPRATADFSETAENRRPSVHETTRRPTKKRIEAATYGEISDLHRRTRATMSVKRARGPHPRSTRPALPPTPPVATNRFPRTRSSSPRRRRRRGARPTGTGPVGVRRTTTTRWFRQDVVCGHVRRVQTTDRGLYRPCTGPGSILDTGKIQDAYLKYNCILCPGYTILIRILYRGFKSFFVLYLVSFYD